MESILLIIYDNVKNKIALPLGLRFTTVLPTSRTHGPG